MKLGISASAVAVIAACVAWGCGGATNDSLFSSNGPVQPFGFGGGTGGAGYAGQPPSFGGISGNAGNAGAVAGGFAGAFGTGGFSMGGFPFPGSGGTADASVGTGGSFGTGGADAGAPPGDGAFNPITCDFSGTWASYVAIDVTWPASIVLLTGQGKLQQWNLTREVQAPLSTNVLAHTKPCGIFLPDLQSTIFGAFQKFGIRFPAALFDKGSIPETDFHFIADITTTPVTFKTDAFAILIGVDLADPVNAAWPAVSAMTLRDDDNDGKPGITVTPVTTAGYSLPPADLVTGESADLVYIATRTVSALAGQIKSCNHLEADVTIQTVNGKPGIDSTVVGCHKQGGTDCSANEASFVDGARPQFTPTGPGHMIIERVADSTTCADVRNRFPQQ